ncbi:MAG: DUF366 family protein [Planctomycetota bacterium]
MQSLFIKKKLNYTGAQLSTHWAYKEFDLKGDSIVAFIGRCDVKPEFMIDLQDLKEGEKIFSSKMLHFIIEHFDADIDKAILRQRLFAAIAREETENISGKKISRDGDDLYYKKRKLSISIATVSPVSSLIHFGLNIETKDVPVAAAGLSELHISAIKLAKILFKRYQGELESISDARARVRVANK